MRIYPVPEATAFLGSNPLNLNTGINPQTYRMLHKHPLIAHGGTRIRFAKSPPKCRRPSNMGFYQSFLMSKAHSNFRCVTLSSSMNLETAV
jgi:hypothetical protein